MRSGQFFTLAVCACFGSGCLATDHSGDVQSLHSATESLARSPIVIVEGGETLLDCRDDALAGVHVLFECDSVTVYSCAPLSTAVVEYEDGARQRFADLHAQIGTFAARGAHDGKRIASVSVETGSSGRSARTRAAALAAHRFRAADDSCGALAAAPHPG